MTVTFPRDLVLEAYLGRWVDITALAEGRGLRQTDPVTISWGSSAEQLGKTPPSTVECVLNNQGGHWTNGNPMSDYYDYLQGRNVPTRLGLRVSSDRFIGRTSAFSWTTSDTGDNWNSANSGTGSVSVGSSFGSHLQPNAAAFVVSYLGDSYGDGQAAMTARWNMNVAGGALEPNNLVMRYQASGAFIGEHYMLRCSVSTAEVLTVAIHHSTLGLISQAPVTFASLTPGLNFIRAKFQAEGPTMRGKVYSAGPSYADRDIFEPLDWQVTAHDDRLKGGFPGVRTGVAAGNSNVPVTVDYVDWEFKLMRHTGEISRLQPTWDAGHKIKKAKVKLADITQRLGRPERPKLLSAARRYLASNNEFTTTDFWPLDEAAVAAQQGLSAVAGGATARFTRETGVTPNRGAVTWGATDRVHTSVPGFVALNNGGRLTMTTQQASLGTSWSIMWAMRLSPDAGGQVFLSTAAVVNRFVFFLYTDGTFELFTNPSGASLATGRLYPAGADGRWVTLGLTTFNNGGAAVGYHINLDGQTLGLGSTTGDGAHSPLAEVLVHVPQPSTGGQGDSCFSSLFITNTRFDTAAAGLGSVGAKASNVLKGWIGERTLARAFRLTAEEAVPFDYWGALGDTRPMGPQRPLPLLDLLQECADAEQAVLYGPRYTAGVAMRPRRTMCVTVPTATLSYSSGQVAPECAPSADDRPSANLVRAEMPDGQSATVTQATGPMNTKNPGTDPEAIGVSPAEPKANVEAVPSLYDVAGWARALGTTPEIRFPKLTVDLRAAELNVGAAALTVHRAMLQVGVGDRVVTQGLAAADVYRDLDQVVRGGTEVFRNVRGHKITINTMPYEKYRTGVFGDATSRYDGAVTILDAQLTSGTTGARNVTTSAGPVWTTTAGAFPMFVVIGGELVAISGITGTGLAAQVMTISARAQNGVVKTHAAGTRVYLYQPVYHQ